MKDYTVGIFHNKMTIHDFIDKYQNQEKYIVYCRNCPNYNNRWSCPPLSFDVNEYLNKYNWIYLIAKKIDLSAELIKRTDTVQKIKQATYDILWPEKSDLAEKLLSLEAIYPSSISLSAGGCSLCQNCARTTNEPCRFPNKMRYSLDSFGFDLSAITRDLLGYEIKWCNDRLPDYYTLVHALLTKNELPSDAITQQIFLSAPTVGDIQS